MKRAKTLAIAVVSVMTLFAPAVQAADSLLDTVGDILGTTINVADSAVGAAADVTGAAVKGSVNVAGSALNVADAALTGPKLYATIDARQTDLDRALVVGVDTGKLTEAQAANFRAELNRIAAVEADMRLNGFTDAEAFIIARDLDTLGLKIQPVVVMSPAYCPIMTTTRTLPLTITTITPVPDDMNIRQRELGNRIDDHAAAGNITGGEHNSLKCAMSAIAGAESNFRADGNLDYVESRKLYKAFDAVGSDLDFYVEDPSIFGLPLRTNHWFTNWEI